jgi:hypothetical protein
MVAATDEFSSTVGGRVWHSLVRRLQETDSLFGIIASQIGTSQRVGFSVPKPRTDPTLPSSL